MAQLTALALFNKYTDPATGLFRDNTSRLIVEVFASQVCVDDVLLRCDRIELLTVEHVTLDYSRVGRQACDPAGVAEEERHFDVAVIGEPIDHVARDLAASAEN